MPLDVTAPKKCQIIAQKAAPRGKFIIIPGFMSKRTYALNRCAPFLLRGILYRELRNYQKKAFGSEKTIPELKTEFTV
jgi:hypothetical protein